MPFMGRDPQILRSGREGVRSTTSGGGRPRLRSFPYGPFTNFRGFKQGVPLA